MRQAYTAVDANGQLALHRLERRHAAAHVALADESQVPALVDRKHEEAAAGRRILLRLDKAGACIRANRVSKYVAGQAQTSA